MIACKTDSASAVKLVLEVVHWLVDEAGVIENLLCVNCGTYCTIFDSKRFTYRASEMHQAFGLLPDADLCS